jgi:D-sedoheptulose 7-phosphate isomerase
MSTLDRLFEQSSSLEEYAKRYASYVAELLADLDCAAIQRVGDRLEEARRAGRTIFVLGNGGSASTASHFANDLGVGPRRVGGAVYRTISLVDSVSQITAVANDVHYDEVFVEQLKTLMNPGDCLLAISASGNSPNVLRAAEYAKAEGGFVIGLTGFAGGLLREVADEVIHIATPHGDYGPVEDVHILLDHLLTSYLARLTAHAALPADANFAAGGACAQGVQHVLIPHPRARHRPGEPELTKVTVSSPATAGDGQPYTIETVDDAHP